MGGYTGPCPCCGNKKQDGSERHLARSESCPKPRTTTAADLPPKPPIPYSRSVSAPVPLVASSNGPSDYPFVASPPLSTSSNDVTEGDGLAPTPMAAGDSSLVSPPSTSTSNVNTSAPLPPRMAEVDVPFPPLSKRAESGDQNRDNREGDGRNADSVDDARNDDEGTRAEDKEEEREEEGGGVEEVNVSLKCPCGSVLEFTLRRRKGTKA